MKRGWKRALAVAGVAAVVATASVTVASSATSSGQKAANHTIKVGVVYSRTGLLSAYGAEYIQGLRLGLEYATKGTNKVSGHKIEFTLVDDGTDPAKAITAFKDLVGQGFKIIAGTVSSGIALQLAPLAAQNKILYISGPAASDLITGQNRYTFRSGRQSFQDVLAANSFLKAAGRNVVVFAQDTAFGQGNAAAVNIVLGGKGHKVDRVLVPLSATDFTPFAQQVKQKNPDLIFVAWAGTTAPAMWRAMDQQGVLDSSTVVTGLAERATWGGYGDATSAPKIKFISHYISTGPKNAVNDWLVAKMKKRNQAPDLFTPDGFVAAQMIVRAVSQANGDDVEKMIPALENWSFAAPKGPQRIRPQDHAMIQPMFQARLNLVSGKWRATVLARISPGNVQPPIRPFTF